MTRFINRKVELDKLVEITTDPVPCFINMYGRRRVGKTRLLKELSKSIGDKITVIYHIFSEETSEIQLAKLHLSLVKKIPNLFSLNGRISDWNDLFTPLFRSETQIILILDEFPYIVDVVSYIPSILQHLWDQFKDSTKLSIILSGSLVSVMQDLMGSKQPLFGRFTHAFHIKPLNFRHSRLFFVNQKLSFEVEVILYCLFGGIPFYLEAITQKNFQTTEEALLEGPLAEFSVFREEVPLELRTFTRSYASYFSILIAIANGKEKFGEISNYIGKSVDITRFLDTLIKLDIIERVKPFWGKKKRHNRYLIKDSFYRFWFRYFFGFSNELSLLGPKQFYSSIIKTSINDFLGYSFEKFCAEYIITLSKENKLQDHIGRIDKFAGTYYDPLTKENSDIELDIIASGADKQLLIIAECKWWSRDVQKTEVIKFIDKAKKFQHMFYNDINGFKTIELWFFTKKMISDKLKSNFKDMKFISLIDMEKYYEKSE